jgi:hypothetical protein
VRFSSLDDVRVLHAADIEVPFEFLSYNLLFVYLLCSMPGAGAILPFTLISPPWKKVGSVMTPSSWSVHMNSAKSPKPKHGPGGIGTIPCNLTGYSWSSHRGRHGV